MTLDLQNETQRQKAIQVFNDALSQGKKIDLVIVRKKRTTTQNSALHLYFKFIAYELNNIGQEFHYQGLVTNGLTSRYTENIVKEFIWKPIQKAMFGDLSTTKLDSIKINEIIDIITKYFGDKGIVLLFPSIETLTTKTK